MDGSSAESLKRFQRAMSVYFDDDIKVRAPFDAKNLLDRVERRLPPTDGPAILNISKLN
jgi:hypothetical protein